MNLKDLVDLVDLVSLVDQMNLKDLQDLVDMVDLMDLVAPLDLVGSGVPSVMHLMYLVHLHCPAVHGEQSTIIVQCFTGTRMTWRICHLV